MSSSTAKLVVLLILLDLSDNLAISTLLPYDDGKHPSLHVFDRRGVLRRITARKEGNFGCEKLEAIEHKPVPSRSLRSLLSPPPPPIQSKRQAMNAPTSPPLIA